MKEIKIGNKEIGKDHPIFVIGEVGINHSGDLERAKRIIDMAVLAGVSAVKFQKREPEVSVPKYKWEEKRETPWGRISYIDYKHKIEFGRKEYDEIDRYCKEREIIWFSSFCDMPSLKFLEKYDLPAYKIASCKLTDRKLLERVATLGKPVILSTGMSTIYQIIKAWKILRKTELILMHCNSEYPTPDENINLEGIKTLKAFFPNNIIGLSSHYKSISPVLIAGVLGARVVEVHITDDRSSFGTDQSSSIEYPGLRRLCRDLKNLPVWLGDGILRVTEQEKVIAKKLRDRDTL